MKNFIKLQTCKLGFNPLMAMVLSVFLLGSCAKENTMTSESLIASKTENQGIVFQDYVKRFSNENGSLISAQHSSSRSTICGPEEYGLVCPGPSIILSDTITISATGCQFVVRMEITECTLNGAGSYVTFRLVDWTILNPSTPPCSTYWSWLLALPPAQFNDEIDILEEQLKSAFINNFMHGYVLANPVTSNCLLSSYYFHAIFFKPLCTKRCQGGSENLPFFQNITCSTDGCCAEITHYCITNGEVVEFGPIFELISECTSYTLNDCPKKTVPVSWCRTSTCSR